MKLPIISTSEQRLWLKEMKAEGFKTETDKDNNTWLHIPGDAIDGIEIKYDGKKIHLQLKQKRASEPPLFRFTTRSFWWNDKGQEFWMGALLNHVGDFQDHDIYWITSDD